MLNNFIYFDLFILFTIFYFNIYLFVTFLFSSKNSNEISECVSQSKQVVSKIEGDIESVNNRIQQIEHEKSTHQQTVRDSFNKIRDMLLKRENELLGNYKISLIISIFSQSKNIFAQSKAGVLNLFRAADPFQRPKYSADPHIFIMLSKILHTYIHT